MIIENPQVKFENHHASSSWKVLSKERLNESQVEEGLDQLKSSTK